MTAAALSADVADVGVREFATAPANVSPSDLTSPSLMNKGIRRGPGGRSSVSVRGQYEKSDIGMTHLSNYNRHAMLYDSKQYSMREGGRVKVFCTRAEALAAYHQHWFVEGGKAVP